MRWTQQVRTHIMNRSDVYGFSFYNGFVLIQYSKLFQENFENNLYQEK